MNQKKTKNYTYTEKTLFLHFVLIFSRQNVSLYELSKILNSSQKELLKIVEELNIYYKYQPAIITEKINKKIICRIDYKTLPHSFGLNPTGLRQILISQEFISQVLPEDLKIYLGNITKFTNIILDLSSTQTRLIPIGVQGHIDYGRYENELSSTLEAIQSKTICLATYKASQKVKEQDYLIAPTRLVLYNDIIYIEAWIFKDDFESLFYDNPTLFMAHRFKKLELTKMKKPKLPILSDDNLVNFEELNQEEEFEVSILFSATVAEYIAERQWSSKQSTKLNADGTLQLTFIAQNWYEVCSWVLSFGEEAQVITPEKLKKEIKDKIKKIAKIYQAC